MAFILGAAIALGTPVPALAAAIPAKADATIVQASPALWQVRDRDTTIYLFGTFHALDPKLAWFDARIAKAFARSDELVLETLIPSDPATARAIGAKQMLGPDGRPKAFAAQTSAAIRQGRTIGLSTDYGADMVLRHLAEERGLRLSGLESFEAQLATLANIPAAPPASAVAAPAAPPSTITMADLLAAWSHGDDRAFAAMLANFEAKSPTAYRMLIADRNAAWASAIDARMQRPGTLFVAVGAGHLAGKDSVLEKLKARGYKVRRVD